MIEKYKKLHKEASKNNLHICYQVLIDVWDRNENSTYGNNAIQFKIKHRYELDELENELTRVISKYIGD